MAARLIAVAAAALATVVLLARSSGETLDYGVGLVPFFVPWLGVCLSLAVTGFAFKDGQVTSRPMSLLIVALAVVTAFSVAMLPFDALRIVRLIPLPLSGPGMSLRLLLLAAAAAAIVPVLLLRRTYQARCQTCRRVLPGRFDALPRWPVVVALLFALVYPALRTTWAVGGTFGTAGGALNLEPVVAWGAALAGWSLVAVVLILVVGRGPQWARAFFGLGGVVAGAALTVIGGLAAVLAVTILLGEGPQSSPGSGLMSWIFLIVYGSWFLAGPGVIVGGWRYWARRRDACPACRNVLQR